MHNFKVLKLKLSSWKFLIKSEAGLKCAQMVITIESK